MLFSEVAIAEFGFLQWYMAALDDVCDSLGASDYLSSAEPIKRRRAFGTIAGSTVLQCNGGDIAVEDRRFF